MSNKKYDDVTPYYDKKHNRYIVKVTVEKGKPRKSVSAKTEEEAVFKARQILYGTRDEEFIVHKGMPLIELVKMNFERRDSAGKIGDAQYNRTQYVIKQIENSKIALKNVRDITERDYQEFFNDISKGYANSSIEKCYAEINQALKYAKRKNIIQENVLEDIIKPKSKLEKKEVKPLTIKQQRILTNYLESLSIEDYMYKNVFLIQMYMGLRIGEVLSLKRSDIDFDAKTIHIQRTLTENRAGKRVIGDMPKTEAGNRVIHIPDDILKYVKEQAEIAKTNTDELLFTNKGKLVRHSSMNSQLKTRLVNLGIYEKGLSTHSLRHTFATRCIEGDMPAVVLSKILGHSDIRVTLKTYVKIFNEYQAKETKSVENYFNELNLFNSKENSKNSEKEQEKLENNEKFSNVIQFPKKRVVNDDFER